MRARSALVATSLAAVALVTACQAGPATPTAASSSAAISPPTSSPVSSPVGSAPSGPTSPGLAATVVETFTPPATVSASVSASEHAADAAAQQARTAAGTAAGAATTAARPVEARVAQGGRYWGVYLASSPTAGSRQVQSAYARLQEQGYTGSTGQAGCDAGALDSIGIGQGDEVASVYFVTRGEAQRFVTTWGKPYLGYVQVRTYCAD